MPKKQQHKGIHKSIKVYFSMLKKMAAAAAAPPASSTTSSSSSRLFSACKYPKTPSFAAHREADGGGGAATLSDVDRFLHENFKSLYARDQLLGSNSPAATASDRSEQSSPPASPSSGDGGEEEALPGGGAAVTTFSKDPVEDFRRSMQLMMDARKVDPGQPPDWDFMEELLFCFLELNDRSVHKYVLRAFTDLTIRIRRREEEERRERAPARRRRSARTEAGRRLPAGR